MLSMLSQDGRTLFDQELYMNFVMNSSRPYFMTFPGDVRCFFFFCMTMYNILYLQGVPFMDTP